MQFTSDRQLDLSLAIESENSNPKRADRSWITVISSMRLTEEDHAFLKDVIASIIVPANSNVTLDELLTGHPDIEQRTSLFFDEKLRLLFCLDFPPCPEDRLQSYLRSLELRVDVWATSLRNVEDRSPMEATSHREHLASEAVAHLEDPVSIINQDDDEGSVRLLLVWDLQITIGRPRTRSSDQSVAFQPVATVANSEDHPNDKYLKPFTLVEPNLLGNIKGFESEQQPYLPASSLEKVLPPAPKTDNRLILKSVVSQSLRAYAAIMPRLKYHRIATQHPNPITIATLDIDIIPFIEISGKIESIEVTMGNGAVVPLMPEFLPMRCKSKDSITFLYKLLSAHQSGTSTPTEINRGTGPDPDSNGNMDVLSIQILMRLEVGKPTKVLITTSWVTNVDFSQALNPAFGAPSQTIQRTNRPTSLNFSPYPNASKANGRERASTTNARTASASLQHQMIPSAIPRQPLTAILSVSFIASDQPAQVGIPFSWRVLIVNNSSRVAKLAIVPLPRIQRPTNATQNFAKRHAPKSSNSTINPGLFQARHPTGGGGASKQIREVGEGSFAKPVVEEHVLYALHHQAPSAGTAAVPPEIDIISLTAELRIGPLGIKQCYETEIEFVAYRTGVFNIDAIRVVDLTRDTESGVGAINDIRELPEVVVVAGPEEQNV